MLRLSNILLARLRTSDCPGGVVPLVAILLLLAPSSAGAQNASEDFALQFDGVDGFVAIPNASELNLDPHNERTIEAWFKVDDKSINTRKQVIWEEGGMTNGLNLYVFHGAVYAGAWSDDNGFGGKWLQTSSIQSGTWHHVALVYDKGSSFTGYLDGSAFGSVGVSKTIDSHGADNAFGRMRNDTRFHDGDAGGDGHELQGFIDEGRVWNSVRTQSQIQNNRFSTLSGSETGLAGYWPFEEGSGTTTSDLASGNDGTLQNGVSWTSDTAPLSGILFVDEDATGANNGTTWADAFTNLQDALATASNTDEIWIAEGTYYPDEGAGVTDDDRDASFTVTGAQDGLEIYGGFQSGDAFNARSPAVHPVILSGDIDQNDDTNGNGSNSYNVLFFDGTTDGTITTATVLDGITVTAGNADGTGSDNKGGGLFCDGVGFGDGCNPQIRNAIFSGNTAEIGGAIYNDGRTDGTASPQITNVTFSGNTASPNQGGAIYNNGGEDGTSNPQITNSTFSGNTAGDWGGAIYNQGTGGTSSPTIVNSTFTNNSSRDGAAIYNNGFSGTSSPQITNAILWGNSATDSGDEIFNDDGATPTLSHTLIEGGVNGSGVGGDSNNNGGNNLDADPLFADPSDPDGGDEVFATEDDGLRFVSGSPAIDAGDDSALPADAADLDGDGNTTESIPHDITGAVRSQEAAVDLGAYESAVDLPPAAPTGLTTTPGTGQADLAWGANSESDLDGYNVYRSTSSFDDPSGATKVNGSLVTGTNFTDTGLSNGTTYHYRTTAVDDAGNESSLSGEATATPTDPAVTYYVDGGPGSDANDGTSWEQAFATLQQALSVATGNDEIWIAEGTYYPDEGPGVTDDDRSASFTVTGAQDGLKIYGGFANGDAFADRNPADHPVTLSGDIGTSDDDTDNSYHVLFFDGTTGGTLTSATVLDGGTVTAGNANDSFPNNAGGGLFCDGNGSGNTCSPTIANATFTNNSATFGAAMINRGDGGGTSNPQTENSTFANNAASTHGGALYNFGTQGMSSPQIRNSTFIDNSATGGVGGAMFNRGDDGGTSSPQIANVTFSENSASDGGGAIYNEGTPFGTSSPSITNATFSNNSSSDGGGAIYNNGSGGSFSSGTSSPSITNTTFSGNSASNHGGAIYNDGFGGTSNPSITNVTFTGNSASKGGAIYNTSRFDDNEAASPTITNTILWGNSATDSGDEIANVEDGATPTIQFSVVEGGQAGISESGGSSTTYDENSNLESDPEFGDAADPAGSDGVHATRDDGVNVLSSSPALDAGDNAAVPSGVTTDITDADRTQDRDGNGTATVNIGAYEEAFVGPPTALTGSASGMTGTTANLGGTVNPNALETTVRAQIYPTSDPSDVRTLTDSDGPFTGTSDQSVTVSIDGLAPSTEYEARIIASNAKGGARGSYATFTTTADAYVRHVKGTDGTGNDAGWRMLALPAASKTRAALEGDLTFSTNSGSILYRWTSGSWSAQTNSGDALPRGRGYMLYFFDDVIDPIDAGGLPLAVGTGSEDHSQNLTVDGLSTSETFHLVGNPYDVAFDLSELNLSGQGFQTTAQIWDPSSQSYTSITESGDGSDVIGAWQGFFVERSTEGEGGTSLTFPTSGKQGSGGDLIGSQSAAVADEKRYEEKRLRLDLRLAALDTTGSDTSPPSPSAQTAPQGLLARPPAALDTIEGSAAKTRAAAQSDPNADTIATGRLGLLLSEDGADGWDAQEATQVGPPGGGQAAVTLSSPLDRSSSESSNGSSLVQRALASEPYPTEERAATLPVAATIPEGSDAAGAEARIGFSEEQRNELSQQLPSGWALRLTDTQAGESADLLTETHSFTLEEGAGTGLQSPSDARFRLAVGPREALPVTEGLSLKPLYPNPATRRVTVEYAVPQKKVGSARIEIYDVMGRRVRTAKVKPGPRTRRIDVGDLASGMYILRLSAEGAQQARKLIVVR